MSILFVLLTYIVIISINYMWFRPPAAIPTSPAIVVRPLNPIMTKQFGFSIPEGYCFHPGHTWVNREGGEQVRVGIDSFAADLVGKIDQIEVTAPNRWVRQGQRLMTLRADGVSLDLLSPIEGVVTAVNQDVVKDPTLAMKDPYKDGWVVLLKAPDFATNRKNLMQSSMVAPWMHYNLARLNAALAKQKPAFAQDGGVPLNGLLQRADPELRQKLIKEFFLN
jgi:glycine cleavage system H lipoate-binding protein